MKSITSIENFAVPMASWSRMAWNAGEIMMASMKVMGQQRNQYLIPDLAVAGSAEADQRGNVIAGHEISQAVMASAQTLGARMLMLGQQLATLSFKQLYSTSMALMSLSASRSAAQSADRQTQLVGDVASDTVARVSIPSMHAEHSVKRIAQPLRKNVKAKRVKASVRNKGKR